MILIPLSASGRFYITAHKNSSGREKVYLISQVMKKFQFPVTVKLVCGYMPRSPCAFTGEDEKLVYQYRCKYEILMIWEHLFYNKFRFDS